MGVQNYFLLQNERATIALLIFYWVIAKLHNPIIKYNYAESFNLVCFICWTIDSS